ncbi:hypothetical protein PanWU01x14_117650 [Parasponia andersonii]|uniref:Uncharacterized protein n=1 Tax=Parasponia andersonii TaxID=3476 RepID=A0A2P5CWQ6_PARAD|nr:hypothetical protein PanWU01x14_117650 [Parasponia andersonii]
MNPSQVIAYLLYFFNGKGFHKIFVYHTRFVLSAYISLSLSLSLLLFLYLFQLLFLIQVSQTLQMGRLSNKFEKCWPIDVKSTISLQKTLMIKQDKLSTN